MQELITDIDTHVHALYYMGNTCLQQAFPQTPTAQPSAHLPWKYKRYRQRMLIKPLYTSQCWFHGISKQRSHYLVYLLLSGIIFYTWMQLNIFWELSLSYSDREPEQAETRHPLFASFRCLYHLGTKSPAVPSTRIFTAQARAKHRFLHRPTGTPVVHLCALFHTKQCEQYEAATYSAQS